MTLAELRKKYVGKKVSEDYSDSYTIPIELDSNPEYQYYAEVEIDDDRKITYISRMTGKRLVGDEATHVNFENIRIRANDYDLIDDEIESLLDPEEVINKKPEHKYVPPQTDEEELRQYVRALDIREHASIYTNRIADTSFERKQIKALMEKLAENEHRFFKIVEEYDPTRFRRVLTLKEITPKKEET